MKYDFETVIDRRGKDAIAVDVPESFQADGFSKPAEGFDFIPMWVADMNFATAPCICERMKKRIDHPCFGYFETTEEYYNSIIRWQKERNGVRDLSSDCIGYENGVLGGVISALGAICEPGGKVLLHSPTYIGFTGSLHNAGYEIILSPLFLDENGIWRIDYDDMEKKLKEHHIHAAIFCSPHNPCGRVWEREELKKVMALYEKYDVYVISDEIWSDLTLEQYCHIPTQSVSLDARNRTIALYAPSKTFNLAGLIGSYHIIYNNWLRDRVRKISSLSHYNNINVLSMHALIAAYSREGMEWVDELKNVLSGHVNYVTDYFKREFPDITVAKPQGTYMLFIDCSTYCNKNNRSIDEILQAGWDVGIGWQDGRPFHGDCHIRINLASPFSSIQKACHRMKEHVFI